MNNFIKLLKEIRKSKKLSQKKLAEKINISFTTINKIELNERIPSIEMFIKICNGLNISYEELKHLTIEYSKLIKPQHINELIYVEFSKSEYIISLLLENIHFKDDFLDIYRNAYENKPLPPLIKALANNNDLFAKIIVNSVSSEKFMIYLFFLDMLIFLAINLNFNINPLSIESFFKGIEILKEKSQSLFNFITRKFNIESINQKEAIKQIKIDPFLSSQFLSSPEFKENDIIKALSYINEKSLIKFYKFFNLQDKSQVTHVYFQPLFNNSIDLINKITSDIETSIKLKCETLGNIILETIKKFKNPDFKEKYVKVLLDGFLTNFLDLNNLLRNAFISDISFIDYLNITKKRLQTENHQLKTRIKELESQIHQLQSELDKLKGKKG